MKELLDPARDYWERLQQALADVTAPRAVVCGAVLFREEHKALRKLAALPQRRRPKLRLDGVRARHAPPPTPTAEPQEIDLDLDDVIRLGLPVERIVRLAQLGFVGLRRRDAEIVKQGTAPPRQEIDGLFVTKMGARRSQWMH